MKPVMVILGVCVVTFFVATVFFALQPHTKVPQQQSVFQASATQANNNGVVLSEFTESSATYVSEPVTQNGLLTDVRAIPHTGIFVSLLQETGVMSLLSSAGTYTFFVPTDEAFARSSVGLAYMNATDKLRFAEHHIVSGKMMSLDSLKYGHATTLSRDELNLGVFDVATLEGNSHVVATYRVQNGIVYVIDIVLQPPERRPFPF